MKNTRFTILMLRLLLGMVYLSAGLSKFAPDVLANLIGPVELPPEVSHTWIAATFTYVAIYQIVAGALLLSQRYALIGLILTIPMSLGILLFTLDWIGTVYVNLFFLALVLFYAWQEQTALKSLFAERKWHGQASKYDALFPNVKLANLSVLFFLLTLLISLFHQSLLLNATALIALFFVLKNLWTYSNYHIIDKLLLVIFGLVSLILFSSIPIKDVATINIYPGVFVLIFLGFLLSILRLLIVGFKMKPKN